MQISATEFKAKCLSLIDRVNATGEPLTITKRGKQVAELHPKRENGESPWAALEGSVSDYVDPFDPSVGDEEIARDL